MIKRVSLGIFIAIIVMSQQIDWVGQLKNKPVADARQYNFAIQSPSGTLTASTPATVTLAPVPLGVNGSDSLHYLYIPTCSGGAQTVLITGGTATSGSSTGTITFTPTNSCTAGWKIGSASAGIVEASYANPNGTINPSLGLSYVYAPITLNPPTTAQAILCLGWGSSLYNQSLTLNTIQISGANAVQVTNCTFNRVAGQTAGAEIQVGDGVTNNVNSRISGNQFGNPFNAIFVDSTIGLQVTDNSITYSNYGMLMRNVVNGQAGDTLVSGNLIIGAPGGSLAAIRYESGAGMRFVGNKVTVGSNYDLDFDCTASCDGVVQIVGNSLQNATTGVIRILNTSSSVSSNWVITGNEMSPGNTTGYNVSVAGATGSNVVTGVIISQNTLENGAVIIGANVKSVNVDSNTLQANGNTGFAIDTSASGSSASVQVTNNNIVDLWASGAYNISAQTLLIAPGCPSAGCPFAELPTSAAPGSIVAVGNATAGSSPCTSGATATIAHRVSGAWKCD